MKAAANNVVGGYYNLGVLYLKGIDVERNVTKACEYLLLAADRGQPKALYQVAKMFQRDIGFKKNLFLVNFQSWTSHFDFFFLYKRDSIMGNHTHMQPTISLL